MSGKLYALSSGPGAADLITVRAARILGQLDVLYAPAGRKGGDSWRSPSYASTGRTHGGPLLPFSDERRQRGKRGGVERRCRGAGPRWRRAGRSGLSPSATPCCSARVFLLQRIGCPEWLEIVRRYLLRRHCRAGETRWPWSSSRWRLSPAPRRKRTLPRRCASMTVWY